MNIKTVLYLAFLISIVIGCSPKGFDRGALAGRLKDKPMEITDDEIKKVYNIKPQIKYPFRLAVYFDSSSGHYYRGNWWKWENEDHEMLLATEQVLKKNNIISDMVVITNSVVQEPTLKGIRLAAARYQADAVLVVKGTSDIDRYYNPLSSLYITIVGMWIFPGSHYDGIFLMEGVLWDVGNEYLYLAVSSDGEYGLVRPGGFIEEEEIIAKAKGNAVKEFSESLVSRLQRMKGI